MRTTSSRIRIVAGLALVLALAITPSAAAKTSACRETAGPSAQAKTLRELQASSAKPTLAITLKGKTEGKGEARLTVKGRKSVGKTARAASAEVIEKPSSKGGDLDATITVAAAPTQRGRSVTVYACTTKAAQFQAGQFKGLVEVSGTRFREFEYAIVVTQRWPFWVPAGILLLIFVAVVVSEWLRAKTKRWSFAPAAGIALLLLCGTYYGQYVYNDTWGDNLSQQLLALFTAAAGVFAAARATATKFASKTKA